FARVFAIPREQTLPQRFGILMHQVLERYHTQLANEEATGGGLPDEDRLMTLFETGWRRLGFRDSNEERQLHAKAVSAVGLYHVRFSAEDSSPVWFERNFTFRIGPHLLRGRVDRVDRHPDGSYELIDYKTGRAKTEQELTEDVQLSVYQMGARESWGLETSAQSYFYVLTGERVPVEHSEEELERVRTTVAEIAAGILKQRFEPTPSPDLCRFCDYRIICPAAEK